MPAIFTVMDGGDSGGLTQFRAIWEDARTNGADDTINFDAGVTSVTLLLPLNTYAENNKLTVTGNGKNTTTIIAPPTSRIFDINVPTFTPTITFTDLKLQGGNVTTGYGGAIRVDNEILVLTNVAFTSNTAESGGGAISITSAIAATMSISGCDFTNNTATTATASSTKGGGAIYLGGAATVTLTTSVFDGNRASTGSSLHATSFINLSSDSSTFKNGVSTATTAFGGGAIFLNSGSSTVLINNSTATGNSSSLSGGFLRCYNAGATLTFQNSLISSNTANTQGGAIRATTTTTITLTNDTITYNTAGTTGGAVHASAVTNVTKSTFSGNTAGTLGGAIYGGPTTTINTSIFKNNSAGTNGGAIRLTGSANTVSFTQFESNTASSAGGAVYYNSATITINNSTFFRNTASTTGGALNTDATGPTTINQSTFNKNTASGIGGGAIAINSGSGGAFVINNSTIYDNTASGSATTTGGGGILRTSASSTVSLNLISTIVSNNVLLSGNSKGVDLHSSASTVSIAGTKNLIGNNSLSNVTFTNLVQNQIGVGPGGINGKLAALADNGGEAAKVLPDGSFVRTMAPVWDSKALHMGLANGFTNDQRGAGFLRDDGSGVDVGAFEGTSIIPSVQLTTAIPVTTPANSTYAFAVTYDDDSGFDTTTFDIDDVTVNGPGFVGGQKATAVNVAGSGKTYVVSYTIPAPSGGWGGLNPSNTFNLGTYSITVNLGQVADDSANFVPSDQIGSFKTSFATTFEVDENSDADDGNYANNKLSFREALNLANANAGFIDTITFDSTVFNTATTITLTAGTRTISDSVVITGPTASLTLDANKTNQQFTVSATRSVTISSLKFSGFSAGSTGSVILMSSGTIALTSTTFSNNTNTGGGGGAVFTASGSVSATINNSTFSNNTSNATGGALRFNAGGASTVTIASSTFSGNTSSSTAGAIYLSTSTAVTINSSTFSNNTAGTAGGAIRSNASTSTVTINNSTFNNNRVTSGSGTGGAADVNGSFNVTSSTFTGNSAGASGGALYVGAVATTATIGSSIFTNNLASGVAGGGGAIRLSSVSVTISSSQFNTNTAANGGGAILTVTGSTVTLSGNTFRGNTAAIVGGAVNHASNQLLTINQNTFNRNTASGPNGGGAIAMNGLGGVTINNSTLYDNTATAGTGAGGGLLQNGTGAITLVSAIVAGSKIGGTGGIDIHSSTPINFGAGVHHNLIGNNDNSNVTFTDVTTNKLGTTGTPLDPSLGALADNGGQLLLDGSNVQTMLPLPGGLAENNGDANGFTFDQRGSGYTRTYVSLTDIGAAERLPAPPTVSTITFGDGTNQRSLVKQIVVTFSESVNFMGSVASAFTVTRTGTGGALGDVVLTATPASGPASVVTITFSGALTEFDSLIDGFYDIKANAAQISGLGGALDGNSDTVPGGSYSETGTLANKHFRYFGDYDGDGAVTQTPDFIEFRNAFGPPSTIFDFDNDNSVDQDDFIKFRNNFGGGP